MQKTAKSHNYDASALSVLEGLEPVRALPGMYTNTECPNHLAQEAIDNSIDEAMAGYASTIKVSLLVDGGIAVEDNGRGMPIDIHPEHGVSGVELIMTRLHAGGKFTRKNYAFSGGLHGVGISVANALSTQMNVEIKRGGQHYRMGFENGQKVSELTVIGSVGQRNTGTMVKFYPDPQFFDEVKFDVKRLKRLLQAKAVLCPSLTIIFYDQTTDDQITWCYASGMSAYFTEQVSDTELLPGEAWVGKHTAEEAAAQWALAWHAEGAPELMESYVNLVPTQHGGTHVSALKSGVSAAMRQFCEIHDLLPRGVKLKPDDVWASCSYVLSVKMTKPQFFGQTKDRLTAKSIVPYVSKVVEDALIVWLNQHMEMAKLIADIVINNAQSRLKQAKKVVRKKVGSGPALPGKLTDCTNPYDQDSELFLVEGDSAGGSARQARDRETQAVLPLRGKILNTWEVSSEQVLASQTVHDIAVAIGVDPNSEDLSACRYGRICILADADSDGNHISTLLCALFVKHFKPLVLDGRVFVAMPPLYRIDVGKTVYYALDDSEKGGILGQLSDNDQKRASVQRFKGLGEMNPSQLRETTMAVDTRRLIQLTISDQADGEDQQMMDMLLAKKRSEDRRSWLEHKGRFANTTQTEQVVTAISAD